MIYRPLKKLKKEKENAENALKSVDYVNAPDDLINEYKQTLLYQIYKLEENIKFEKKMLPFYYMIVLYLIVSGLSLLALLILI